MEEIWKDVVGYEGLYQLSNLGRVCSCKKNGRQSVIKSFYVDKDGYFCVRLWKNAKVKNLKVHRLVAMHFIPNNENKPCIDHINTIKTDNRVVNLRWCTVKENANNPLTRLHQSIASIGEKATELTRLKMSIKHRGELNGMFNKRHTEQAKRKMSRPIVQFTKDGEFIAEYYGASNAHDITGIHRQTIVGVLKGRGRTAGGFIWKYKEVK